MKYKLDIVIDAPIKKVTELFFDPEQNPHWQPGFLGIDHISGKKGEAGAKSTLRFKRGSGVMEMTETIIVNDPPREFSAIFETPKVWNENKNYFSADGQKTRWLQENTFTCRGMMRLFVLLMPGMFKKESQKYMQLFKEFVERKS